MYQCYPNKQSLLFAVFEEHLDKVSQAVEAACADACHKPMYEMIRRVVKAFVDVKMQRADISVALYKVAPEVGGTAFLKQTGQRFRKMGEHHPIWRLRQSKVRGPAKSHWKSTLGSHA